MRKFTGLITALITPFSRGEVDYASLKELVKVQLSAGIQGFVINGTTAESPNLTREEKKKIFETVKSMVPGDFPLIFGSGSNSTQKTIEESRWAEKLGADAVLVVVPYYNKPPQAGLLEHFKATADSINIPTILYNVPSRTVIGLELETIKKLSHHPRIIGIKEASGKIDFAEKIRAHCGQEFILLSGDDATYDQFMNIGGDGAISVAAHIVPQDLLKKNVCDNANLIDLLFVEANPIPVKMALHYMGIITSPELRLPLVTMSEVNAQRLKQEMQRRKII